MLGTVDDDEKVVRIVYTPGGEQECWMLTENGVYEVLTLSRDEVLNRGNFVIKVPSDGGFKRLYLPR